MLYLSSCAVPSSTDRCASLSDSSLMSASRKCPITCTRVLTALAQLRAGRLKRTMMAARAHHSVHPADTAPQALWHGIVY